MELVLGRGVVRVLVRVTRHRQPAVRFFNVCLRRLVVQPQRRVVVLALLHPPVRVEHVIECKDTPRL